MTLLLSAAVVVLYSVTTLIGIAVIGTHSARSCSSHYNHLQVACLSVVRRSYGCASVVVSHVPVCFLA